MTLTRTLAMVLLGCMAMAGGCSTNPPQEAQKKETATMPDNPVETVLQMTLDSDGLNKYFHVEERPERKPLRILSNNTVPATVRLQKFGEPAVWTTAAESEGKPLLEFTSVKVEAETATVSFRYPPEGISGTVEFRKQGETWTQTGSRIAEN